MMLIHRTDTFHPVGAKPDRTDRTAKLAGCEKMTCLAPKIGITARYHIETKSFRVAEEYVQAIIQNGGQPYILPFDDVHHCDQLVQDLDGLLLTGGEDIDPEILGDTNRDRSYRYHPDRDRFEISLARASIANDLPTLGICRGCQILYVATGGKIIPDISKSVGEDVLHRRSRTEVSKHDVSIRPGSKLSSAYGNSRIAVTSYHHQGLECDETTLERWEISASSDDGLVEAIELQECGWVVGVLWHPELDQYEHIQSNIISRFLNFAGGHND